MLPDYLLLQFSLLFFREPAAVKFFLFYVYSNTMASKQVVGLALKLWVTEILLESQSTFISLLQSFHPAS